MEDNIAYAVAFITLALMLLAAVVCADMTETPPKGLTK